MPDIDALMQEWPAAFEELLRSVPLPSADVDMPTDDFARVACALLDIPVHAAPAGAPPTPGSLIQSLHLLFSLYADFRDNAHFAAGGGARGGAAGAEEF